MFFNFTQNNSGGSFDFDPKAGISVEVIIEATDGNDASVKAQNIGIYFDGCSKGLDCDCCGDRWHDLWNNSGTETPESYGVKVFPGMTVEEYNKDADYNYPSRHNPEGYIHYLDGRIKPFKII